MIIYINKYWEFEGDEEEGNRIQPVWWQVKGDGSQLSGLTGICKLYLPSSPSTLNQHALN